MATREGQPAIEVQMDVCRPAARDLLNRYATDGGLNYGPETSS